MLAGAVSARSRPVHQSVASRAPLACLARRLADVTLCAAVALLPPSALAADSLSDDPNATAVVVLERQDVLSTGDDDRETAPSVSISSDEEDFPPAVTTVDSADGESSDSSSSALGEYRSEGLWRLDWDVGVVRPSLSADEYVKKLEQSIPLAKESLRLLVEDEEFKRAQDSLLFSPFDDVRQSSFYLPFAMGDTDAGARQRVLWSDVKSAMETFDETLASANRFDAELEDVLLDMDRLWRAVDAFFMAAAHHVRSSSPPGPPP